MVFRPRCFGIFFIGVGLAFFCLYSPLVFWQLLCDVVGICFLGGALLLCDARLYFSSKSCASCADVALIILVD